MNSWLHNLEALARGRNRCTLLIHRATPPRRGIADGDRVRVQLPRRRDQVPAVVSDGCAGSREPAPRLRPRRSREPAFGGGPAARRQLQPLADEQLVDELSGNAVLCGIPVEVALG